jgi:hypothetical protein
MHGDDLKPLQTALHANKFYFGKIDGVFGAGTAHAAQQAKWRLGYPKKDVLPTGGQQLLNFLNGSKKLPPAFVVRRHLRGYGVTKVQKQRAQLVAHAKWAVANGAQIHYAETRPMDHLHQIRALPWTSDCSEFVTTLYCWVGAPDPNGLNYNGEGYTGTLLDHGITIPLFQAQPGDVIIWGYGTGHHTALIVEAGTANNGDPHIVSQGSEVGPLFETVTQETAAQASFGAAHYVIKRYLPD